MITGSTQASSGIQIQMREREMNGKEGSKQSCTFTQTAPPCPNFWVPNNYLPRNGNKQRVSIKLDRVFSIPISGMWYSQSEEIF